MGRSPTTIREVVPTEPEYIPFISIDNAEIEGGNIERTYHALMDLFDIIDDMADIEFTHGNEVNTLLDITNSVKLTTILEHIGAHSAKIWLHRKDQQFLFTTLGHLNDMLILLSECPFDGDYFIDFTNPRISKLFSLFDLAEVVDKHGKVYNFTCSNCVNMRNNLRYIIEGMIQYINLEVHAKYLKKELNFETEL